MNGKIDEEGFLHIFRSIRRGRQFCPHGRNACGDWCPLFGEPGKNESGPYLVVCQMTLYFEKFTDERKKEK